MTKIHLLSDIHLEFTKGRFDGYVAPRAKDVDVVILAGDIHPGTTGIMWAGNTYKKNVPVIYVPGNHEYYGKSIPHHDAKMAKAAADTGNVHLLNNATMEIAGTRFVCATLWTDMNLRGNAPLDSITAASIMNDYHRIRDDGYGKHWGRKLSPHMTMAFHRHSVNYIAEVLETPFDGPTVVVTHMLPTEHAIHDMYKGSEATYNAFYASNLEWMMDRFEPAAWVFGHSHRSVDKTIFATRLLSNPRGYIHELNPDFDPGFVFEV